MYHSTFDRILAIEMKELEKIKMLTLYLNKLLETKFDCSVLGLDKSCATVFNCIKKESSSCPFKLSNLTNEEVLTIWLHFDDVLIGFLEIELGCFDNIPILKAITSFLNTNIESVASLDTIQIPQMMFERKQELDRLMKHASISHEMRYKPFVPWSPFTLCYLLIHHLRFKKILRDTLAHSIPQDKNLKTSLPTSRNLKSSATLQALLRAHGDLAMNELSRTASFEDLLPSMKLAVQPRGDLDHIQHIVTPAVSNGRIVAHGYFSKLPDLKRRCNQPKLDMHFGAKSKIDALFSYPIKFTHVASMFTSNLLPKRILVTASGALTSDTVIAGRRKKHFSQAFIGYLSPEYSKKYTSNCSNSVSIAGALTAIKSYLRRRKEEYYSKKAASTKKLKAPQVEQTYYTLTNSIDVFEEAGYGFYCF